MSAPSPLPGRGRGVARRRGFRLKPLRRPGAEALEDDAAGPEHVYVIPNTWRPMPLTATPDPARAAWIEKLLADPAGARRELLEQRLQYWRSRLRRLEEKLAAAEQAVRDALNPPIDEDGPPPVPAAIVWELQAAAAAAWAEVQHALAQMQAVERGLTDA